MEFLLKYFLDKNNFIKFVFYFKLKMKKIFIVFIGLLALNSCSNSAQQEKEEEKKADSTISARLNQDSIDAAKREQEDMLKEAESQKKTDEHAGHNHDEHAGHNH